MSTAMSTKRSFLSDRSTAKPAVSSSEVHLSLYSLIAGVLLMIVGVKASVDVVMIVGFFFAACGALALNALFWASYYAKHGHPKFNARPYSYE